MAVTRSRKGMSWKYIRQSEALLTMALSAHQISSLTLHPLVTDVQFELIQKGAAT